MAKNFPNSMTIHSQIQEDQWHLNTINRIKIDQGTISLNCLKSVIKRNFNDSQKRKTCYIQRDNCKVIAVSQGSNTSRKAMEQLCKVLGEKSSQPWILCLETIPFKNGEKNRD